MKNYYEILEIDQKASFKEIRSSFRRLCKRYHPDINPADRVAEEHFKDLQDAYNVLKDGIKREEFDEYLSSIGYRPDRFKIFANSVKNRFAARQTNEEFFDPDQENLDFRPRMEKSSKLYLKIAAIVVFPLLALGCIAYLENHVDNTPFANETSYDTEVVNSLPVKEITKNLQENDKRFLEKMPKLRTLDGTVFKKPPKKKQVAMEKPEKGVQKVPVEPEKPLVRAEETESPVQIPESATKTVAFAASKAPEESASATELNRVYTGSEIEKRPQFPGGSPAFLKYLNGNLNYPSTAKEDGISGRVLVNFIIEKDGRITNVAITQGIGGGCDEEALRVMQHAPAWIPGELQGEKVRVKANIPITFRLK